jgi:hypothetical protein
MIGPTMNERMHERMHKCITTFLCYLFCMAPGREEERKEGHPTNKYYHFPAYARISFINEHQLHVQRHSHTSHDCSSLFHH